MTTLHEMAEELRAGVPSVENHSVRAAGMRYDQRLTGTGSNGIMTAHHRAYRKDMDIVSGDARVSYVGLQFIDGLWHEQWAIPGGELVGKNRAREVCRIMARLMRASQ